MLGAPGGIPASWGSAKEGQTEHGTGRTEAGLVSPLFPVISPETGSPKRCWNGPGTAKFLTFPLNWPSTTCALPRHRRLGASLRMRGTGRAVRAQRAWLSGREPWHSRCNQDAISQTCQTTCVPHRTLHLLRDGFPGSPLWHPSALACSCHCSSRIRKLALSEREHSREEVLRRRCNAEQGYSSDDTLETSDQGCRSFVQRSAVCGRSLRGACRMSGLALVSSGQRSLSCVGAGASRGQQIQARL